MYENVTKQFNENQIYVISRMIVFDHIMCHTEQQ